MEDDGGSWLTYQEAGDRLGMSPEAVRAKAARKRWRRQIGNDGRARVWLPEDERPRGDRPITGRSPPERENEHEPVDQPVTMRSSPGHRAVNRALVHALESHIKTLQGDNEALREQLAAERTAFASKEAALAGDLVAEKARVDQAIAAFSALAERLDALAAERARSWWRRLVG